MPAPQECSEITAHVFTSLRFDTTYHIPAYHAGIDMIGQLELDKSNRLSFRGAAKRRARNP